MIFAIKPFEIHDGDGIRTTVFFKGCPLRCEWCHNPESFEFGKEISYDNTLCKNCMKCVSLCDANITRENRHVFVRENCTLCGKCEEVCFADCFEIMGKDLSPEEIADEILKDEIFMKGSGGGVTFSGGEPLMQIELCLAIAKILKKHDINIAIDTSGYVNRENIEKIMPYTDTFLFDIKAIDEDIHINCTGVSNKQILENLRFIDAVGIPIEIRYPFVPNMNDCEAEKIIEYVNTLNSVKAIKLLPYHDFAKRKYSYLGKKYFTESISPPDKERILLLAENLKKKSKYKIIFD